MPAPTLLALASGRPPAATSDFGISGATAFEEARRLTGKALPPPRTARLRTLRDLASGEALDKALLLLFPGPDSATGDDIAELHLHGGVAVVAAVLKALDGIERSEEHTSELQSLMRISYAVFCLKKKKPQYD